MLYLFSIITIQLGLADQIQNPEIANGSLSHFEQGGYEMTFSTDFGNRFKQGGDQVAFRYFLSDEFSLGGYLSTIYEKKQFEQLEFGLSARWYFYQTKHFAWSLQQELGYIHDFANSPWSNAHALSGRTLLGVQYFINPDLYLGVQSGLSYQYRIKSNYPSDFSFALETRVFLGFDF